MTKFSAEIEIKDGQIYITPNDSYIELETFCWDNRDKKVNDIISVLPF